MNSLLAHWMAAGFASAASLTVAQTMPVNAAPSVLHPLAANEWMTESYRLNFQRMMMQATDGEIAGVAIAGLIATLEDALRGGLPEKTVSGLREGDNSPHAYNFKLVVSPDFSQPISVCVEKENRIRTALIFPDGNVQMVEPLAQPRRTADAGNPDEFLYACLPHSAIVANRMLDALDAQAAAGDLRH